MDTKKAILAKRKKQVLSPGSAVSSGCTLLNLSCSDHPSYAFPKGKYIYLVGDSTSGKTFLTLTCFAEAQINKHFQDYELHFDDVEEGALMDIAYFFGKKVAAKMQRHSSSSIQDFYRRMDDLIASGKKFIYVLDSQDALDNTSARKKFQKQKKQAAEGTKEDGSYGDGKAKYHSENIRWVLSGLRKTGSILIIIGQTRDNLNPFSFEKKIRSGGKSLKFYATLEIWTAVGKKIKKKIGNIKRDVGVFCVAEIRKNRLTGKVGKDRCIQIPIYNDFGIDDVGANVDFLIKNKTWPKIKNSNQFRADGLNFKGSRNEIIRYVEKNGHEETLKELVAKLWNEIEEAMRTKNRKHRYE